MLDRAVKRRAGCVGQVFLVFGEGEELMAVSGESQYRGCRLSGGRRDWELKMEGCKRRRETRNVVNEDNDERTRAIFLLFEFRRDRRRDQLFLRVETWR